MSLNKVVFARVDSLDSSTVHLQYFDKSGGKGRAVTVRDTLIWSTHAHRTLTNCILAGVFTQP